MLKITMPIYTATFPEDFKKLFFNRGDHGTPLESPMPGVAKNHHYQSSITCKNTKTGALMKVKVTGN